MKKINTIAKIAAKIMEVGHWVAAALMTATAICSAAAPRFIKYFIDIGDITSGTEISVYGFEVTPANSAGEINMTTLGLFAVGTVIIFSLMAMVFRNLYLIIKKSEGSTPFQKDNIRMLKEIGIFYISIPIIGLIMSTLIRVIVGIDAVEISINFDGFTTGIIVLCLSQFFAHGAKLEKDVDGLV